MKFVLERTTEPEFEPVTRAEMKRSLQEFDDVTSRDTDIDDLITAGREWVEDYTGRILVDQTWRISLNSDGNFGDDISIYRPVRGYYHGWFQWERIGEIMLRKSPVLAITSFVTVDSAGVETAVAADTYELREQNSKWPRIASLSGDTWSTQSHLRVTFRAGYADTTGSPREDASVIPERFKQAIKLWVKANYDIDPVMTPMLLKTAENLIKSERSALSMA